MANPWKDPEFLKKLAIAKEKAWTSFLNHFPKVNKSWFVSQESSDKKNNATTEVFSKKAKAPFKASSVQTGGIGVWK